MTTANRLSAISLKILPDGWHADGNNLYFRVVGDSRTWVYREMRKGTRVTKTLGIYPRMTLKDARREAMVFRVTSKPSIWSRNQTLPKFGDIYASTVSELNRVRAWKNPLQAKNMLRRIEQYAKPLNKIRINQITMDDVYDVLKNVWYKAPTQGTALQRELSMLFQFLIVKHKLTTPNPALWKGGLEHRLTRMSKVHNAGHHKKASLEELPDAISVLMLMDDMAAKCALFGILTATRKIEFVHAKRDEFDLDNGVWYVPAERRKDGGKEPFRVALSRQAINLVKSIRGKEPELFYCYRDMYNKVSVLYRKNFNFTAHGMRSVFMDWGVEKGHSLILLNKCLCHSVGGAVTQAYQRSDCLEQRRPIMQDWADEVLGGLDF